MCFLESLYMSLRREGACTLFDMQGRFPNAPLHTLKTGLYTLQWHKYARRKGALYCPSVVADASALRSVKLVKFELEEKPKTLRARLDLVKKELKRGALNTRELSAAFCCETSEIRRVLCYGAKLREIKVVRRSSGARPAVWALV